MPYRNNPSRNLLSSLNYVVAIAGLLIVSYAAYLRKHLHKDDPECDSIPPAAAMLFGDSSVRSGDQMIELLLRVTSGSSPGGFLPLDEWKHFVTCSHGNAFECPWVIYLVGGLGAFILTTALVGVFSGCCASCGISLGGSKLYRLFMFAMIAVTAGALITVSFDKHWRKDINSQVPDDCTGDLAVWEKDIQTHKLMTQFAGLGVLAVQVVALWVSYRMHSDGPPPDTVLLDSDIYESVRVEDSIV